MTFDVTRNPFRMGQMFDACVLTGRVLPSGDPWLTAPLPPLCRIVTDPPYGVRAGAKRIGRKDPTKVRREPFIFPEGHPEAGKASHAMPDCASSSSTVPLASASSLTMPLRQDIPPFKPYEIADLAVDLVRLARYALRPGGRLVFFLPVVSEKYENVDVPLVEGMTVVGNSVEDFGKWARRKFRSARLMLCRNRRLTDLTPRATGLITLELSPDALPVSPPVFESEPFGAPTASQPAADGSTDDRIAAELAGISLGGGAREREPGHKDFRGQYFSGFKSGDP